MYAAGFCKDYIIAKNKSSRFRNTHHSISLYVRNFPGGRKERKGPLSKRCELQEATLLTDYPLQQWYSTWGTLTTGGMRRR
jgi:hypothetical protein